MNKQELITDKVYHKCGAQFYHGTYWNGHQYVLCWLRKQDSDEIHYCPQCGEFLTMGSIGVTIFTEKEWEERRLQFAAWDIEEVADYSIENSGVTRMSWSRSFKTITNEIVKCGRVDM